MIGPLKTIFSLADDHYKDGGCFVFTATKTI